MEKFHWKNSFFPPPSLSLSLPSSPPFLSLSSSPPHFSSFFLSSSPSLFPPVLSTYPYLILFYLLYTKHYICRYSFLQVENLAVTLLRASLLLLFSNSICSLCVSISHFIHSHNMQTFFVINTIFIINSIFMVISTI